MLVAKPTSLRLPVGDSPRCPGSAGSFHLGFESFEISAHGLQTLEDRTKFLCGDFDLTPLGVGGS